jgi:hypothetical protein
MKSIDITEDMIVSSIGKAHDSPEVKKLFHALGVTWEDMEIEDVDMQTRGHESKEKGFSLLFEDICEYEEIPNHDRGDGPFLLDSISFWGHKKGFNKFNFLPLKGINFESTIDEVQSILGSGSQKNYKGPREPFSWHYENYKISMHWPINNLKNEVITFWYTPKN